jgi:hypothetical protein
MLIQVDGISRHHLVSISDRVVCAPVELKHLAVGIKGFTVRARQVFVLHYCADGLRQKGRIRALEKIQTRTYTFDKLVKFGGTQVLVSLLSVFGNAKLVLNQHLTYQLFPCWSVLSLDCVV